MSKLIIDFPYYKGEKFNKDGINADSTLRVVIIITVIDKIIFTTFFIVVHCDWSLIMYLGENTMKNDIHYTNKKEWNKTFKQWIKLNNVTKYTTIMNKDNWNLCTDIEP